MVKSRDWVFTMNNYKSADVTLTRGMNYLVYVPQVAPSTGTPHLQGYVQFKTERDENGAYRAFKTEHPEVHLEQARETWQYNKDVYFTEANKAPEQKSNQGPIVEKGTPEDIVPKRRPEKKKQNEQGKRTDIAAFKAFLLSDYTEKELYDLWGEKVDRHPRLLVMANLMKERRNRRPYMWPITLPWKDVKGNPIVIQEPKPSNKQRHVLVVGAASSGKTDCIGRILDGGDWFLVQADTKYPWESYDNEQVIVIDDMEDDFEEKMIINCCNCWKKDIDIAKGARYVGKKWRKNQARVIIWLENKTPSMFRSDRIRERFKVYMIDKPKPGEWLPEYRAVEGYTATSAEVASIYQGDSGMTAEQKMEGEMKRTGMPSYEQLTLEVQKPSRGRKRGVLPPDETEDDRSDPQVVGMMGLVGAGPPGTPCPQTQRKSPRVDEEIVADAVNQHSPSLLGHRHRSQQ